MAFSNLCFANLFLFLVTSLVEAEVLSSSTAFLFGRRARQFRLTYVFKRSRAPFVARDLVSKRGCSRAL